MNKEELHLSVIENTDFTFARSGGKGGQNVNKVNTKVHGTLDLHKVQGLTSLEREQAFAKLSAKINSAGLLFVDCESERSQELNKKIALNRLENWIQNAAVIQPKRKKTKPTKSSKEKRLASKKLHSLIKQSRKRIFP